MTSQIELTAGGKVLLFIAGIAALLAAIGKLVLQPLFSAWIFFTLEREPAKVREVVTTVFKDEIAELVRSAREIRECQAEQGRELSELNGYLRGKEE